MVQTTLPSVPVQHQDLLKYIESNNEADMSGLLKPYNEYDAVLRRAFAQEPAHPALKDNHLNLVPVYDNTGSTDARVRARDLDLEPPELKEKYLLPLDPENRKPNGSPAVVQKLSEFQTNFSLFTEGSLSDINWSNVVVAGSAVVTCLMPVPQKYRDSKRSMRQFYHEEFAPASDVDLFLYGLTEEQAMEKIRHIEKAIQGSILQETTTIRTKNTITIASQYPTRHVQIVLRIYKSIAEILTGFDVDCSCAAYDGKQVYVAPRALASYITQVNQIDLTRRSPSYENRLSKYSHRGFEVFWAGLDRSRIDPTAFERSFARTVGLARLLVLEQLPRQSDREKYIEKRREERGRPSNRNLRRERSLRGNIKNEWEDEVPEWMEEDAISDYHTFTIPYGPKFHARKIEKLLYTKDLLLNAEWNRPKDRQVNLHRHPAFFGNLDDVIHDCCGYCPQPVTDEEKEVAEEENKIYISGDVTFIKDDPGRQEIGSFNPITETDWTEMAYVGNTERLCQAIVDHNLEEVKCWLEQETSDPNTRDYTGRTPLQLACMTSTPEVVQCLVDHGARLISRIADGRTALHLAAARGDMQIVRILLSKSEQNEEDEAQKEELRKYEKRQGAQETQSPREGPTSDSEDENDVAVVSDNRSATSHTVGSFVKVGIKDYDDASNKDVEDENELEPDIYDVNVQAWDHPTSPLHLAILNGHIDVVEELVASFGADVMLPVKLIEDICDPRRKAILTLVLALQLPLEKAKAMTEKLLQLGASPAQAEVNGNTALNYVAACGYTDLLDVYIQLDQPAVKRIINRLVFSGSRYYYNSYPLTAFTTAIDIGDTIGALKLLNAGADASIGFDEFMESGQSNIYSIKHNSVEENREMFERDVEQPVITAVKNNLPELALELLSRGVDPNTLTTDGLMARAGRDRWHNRTGTALLDYVRQKLNTLRMYKGEDIDKDPPRRLEPDDGVYLGGLQDGTYEMWAAKLVLKRTRLQIEKHAKHYERAKRKAENRQGLTEKMNAVKDLVEEFKKLEQGLIERGAKTFKELYPHIRNESYQRMPTFEQEEPAPFKIRYTFSAPALTDIKEKGYLRL
ncbi:ankyrin repeat protein [Aspergillus sclerotialis]|uniref:Ankyrin repeat protein n=1 Tax=Aspergillus sclerotialis TaxID=2070753 RepID=A0A3A2ZQA6_9EURO|nr:ankyrin repeat protein [Aspergillus sclerotialis]